MEHAISARDRRNAVRREFRANNPIEAHRLDKAYRDKDRDGTNRKQREYRKANRDKLNMAQRVSRAKNKDVVNAATRAYRHSRGVKPMSENRECGGYLGIYISERVLAMVFKDVVKMPVNHPGYDFICAMGKMVDVKAATMRVRDFGTPAWSFHIRNNTIADYFLCVAFDNRCNLNPMHIWLIPGDVVNTKQSATISIGTLGKWDEYKLDITKVITCCDKMKGEI